MIDINNPYDVLNTMFPGEFRREDRFKLNKPEIPVYDLSQAAAYLRLSERQLCDLVRHRRITCFYRRPLTIRVNRRINIQIDDFINRSRREACR